MTRISTDPTPALSDTSFRRRLVATVVVVALACAAFVVLGYLQGPKFSSAQVDPRTVTEKTGQQLRIFTNEAVAAITPQQVGVEPVTPTTVTTTGQLISIQFSQPLDYATHYTVTIAGVTSLYSPQTSTLSYSFTTSSPALFYLYRGDPRDQIVSADLTGAGHATVFSAQHIQDFARVGKALGVVTLNDDHTSKVTLVNISDGTSQPVILPDRGVVEKIDGASTGDLVGFTLTSALGGPGELNNSALYTINFAKGRAVTPVLGVDGKQLEVLDWMFVPGTRNLIALSINNTLLYLDPTTPGSVIPLGQYLGMDGVSPDGKVVTATDPFGTVAVTIADGTKTRLPPSPLNGSTPYLGETTVVEGEARIETVAKFNQQSGKFSTFIAYDDGKKSRLLFATVDNLGTIDGYTISPNGQYVAIAAVPDASVPDSDGYYFDAKPKALMTEIVNIQSGAVVRTLEGFSLSW